MHCSADQATKKLLQKKSRIRGLTKKWESEKASHTPLRSMRWTMAGRSGRESRSLSITPENFTKKTNTDGCLDARFVKIRGSNLTKKAQQQLLIQNRGLEGKIFWCRFWNQQTNVGEGWKDENLISKFKKNESGVNSGIDCRLEQCVGREAWIV